MQAGDARHAPDGLEQRRRVLAAGAAAAAVGALGLLGAFLRSLVPQALYEAPRRFPVGRPADYPPGSATLVAERRVFIFNAPDGFYAVSAVCTHLGCNVEHEAAGGFACPCHGSRFGEDGRVSRGPAAWPLPRFALSLSRRGELVVDTRRTVAAGFRLLA